MPVALVHVPVVSAAETAYLYASRAELVFAPLLSIFVHPAGSAGAVALPSRYANATIRSPTWCVGIVTVVAAAEAEEMYDTAIRYLNSYPPIGRQLTG